MILKAEPTQEREVSLFSKFDLPITHCRLKYRFAAIWNPKHLAHWRLGIAQNVVGLMRKMLEKAGVKRTAAVPWPGPARIGMAMIWRRRRFLPTELTNLTKGITHETDGYHGDSTDRRKRMGAAPRAGGSGGEQASE